MINAELYDVRDRSELQKQAGDDWLEVANDPDQLRCFADMLAIEDMRQRGIVPDHYSATTECKGCGPVPIFEGLPNTIRGCPWCFNRLKGLPMPMRPTAARGAK